MKILFIKSIALHVQKKVDMLKNAQSFVSCCKLQQSMQSSFIQCNIESNVLSMNWLSQDKAMYASFQTNIQNAEDETLYLQHDLFQSVLSMYTKDATLAFSRNDERIVFSFCESNGVQTICSMTLTDDDGSNNDALSRVEILDMIQEKNQKHKLDFSFFKTLSRFVSRSDRVEIGVSGDGEIVRISIPLDQSTNPGGVGSTKNVKDINPEKTIVFKYKLLQWAHHLLDGPTTYVALEDRGMLFMTENVAILVMGIEPE